MKISDLDQSMELPVEPQTLLPIADFISKDGNYNVSRRLSIKNIAEAIDRCIHTKNVTMRINEDLSISFILDERTSG